MISDKTLLVTGGAGFIGSAFVREQSERNRVIVLDSLTYAGDMSRIRACDSARMTFIKGDIRDEVLITQTLREHRPDAILHFAAESHVDRSIDGPIAFLETNVEGTMTLLRCATAYWSDLKASARESFRFLHVSTDEVYGSLSREALAFTETSPYRPNSPYAASKAASDHFVRAWHKTFGLPTLITHCSNNYGPWQFPEKLIPLMISKCLKGEPLPVYGDGQNIRDWIHVDDHVTALSQVLLRAAPGSVWGIGGEAEVSNIDLVKMICDSLDERVPRSGQLYCEQITFVRDRPGHDVRYAIDLSKIKRELGWSPAVSFESGLSQTIDWYLASQDWINDTTERGDYQAQQRLGVSVGRESGEESQ